MGRTGYSVEPGFGTIINERPIKIYEMIRSLSLSAILLLLGNYLPAQFYNTGGYQGGAYGSGGDKTLDVVVLDLKVYLQGAYRNDTMHCDLDSLDFLPLEQPYDSVPFYWHYTGTEAVDSIPGDNVVDWIEVELRETTGGPSTATEDSVIGRRAGFLLADGTITDLDGSSKLRFKYVTVTNNLYVVIKHRNHLGIMSSVPLTLVDEVHAYDLTGAQSLAYQDPAITGNAAMADLGGGKFGLWAGNAYADFYVKYSGPNNDRQEILSKTGTSTPSNVLQDYHRADVNMDSWIRYMGANNDKVFIYNILGGDVADSLQSHVP